jgi:hypothetical protein
MTIEDNDYQKLSLCLFYKKKKKKKKTLNSFSFFNFKGFFHLFWKYKYVLMTVFQNSVIYLLFFSYFSIVF